MPREPAARPSLHPKLSQVEIDVPAMDDTPVTQGQRTEKGVHGPRARSIFFPLSKVVHRVQ